MFLSWKGTVFIMTIGENIRRIRKERGLTIKQLAELVGVNESYIRAYESGRRNPKQKSLEALANALRVNVEVLVNSEFDGVKAIHRLFQVFRQYNGHMKAIEDENGVDQIYINFGSLILIRSWYERYAEYQQEIEACNKIKDIRQRTQALLKAEESFDMWMDIYPDSEPQLLNLQLQAAHDHNLDVIGLNPKNPE